MSDVDGPRVATVLNSAVGDSRGRKRRYRSRLNDRAGLWNPVILLLVAHFDCTALVKVLIVRW